MKRKQQQQKTDVNDIHLTFDYGKKKRQFFKMQQDRNFSGTKNNLA